MLEAMALGVVPVICDYAGPGELVDDAVGYKIQMGSRDEIISRLRSQIGSIIADPTELTRKGKTARERVLAQFTWEAKARQVLQAYDLVLERRSEKPRFFSESSPLA